MGYTDAVEVADWRELEPHEFCMAFPRIPEDEYEELRQSIVGSGLRQPIILFEGKILDGRHRHEICAAEDIEPIFEEFNGPGSAYSYVIDTNLRRRNLSPAQKIEVSEKLVEIMSARAKGRQMAGLKQNQSDDTVLANLPKREQADQQAEILPFPEPATEPEKEEAPVHTHAEVSKLAGVSPRTAQDALTIKNKGTQEDWQEVLDGKASVSAKAKQVRQRQAVEETKPRKSEFITLDDWKGLSEDERAKALATVGKKSLNKQDNEAIGWAKWSWNPVTGCLHNCPYCYARDIANRFYEQGFKPSLLPERLTAPQNQKPRESHNLAERNIFTCSMADLFGKWVPEEWIEAVMASVRRSPDWNFLFLTKFPKRMIDRDVPENVWLGTTVDMQSRVKAVEDAFERVPAHTRWLSIEPLIEPLQFSRPELFQWVVIGGASASSQTPAWSPPFEWVADLYMTFKRAGAAVYLKDNIGFDGKRRPREFPWQDLEPEVAPESFRYRGNQK